MANTKTLSNIETPTINGLDAGVVFAATAMENIYQDEIEKGGRGCTQQYSNDTTGAQIRVVRPLPLPIDARELGAAINGGNFSAFRHEPKSQAYGLDIITVIDDIVDIPDVRMDMIPVDVAKLYIQNISDKVVLNMNAIKIAARIYSCFNAAHTNSKNAYIIEKSSDEKLLDAVIKTNGKLNKGDAANGVATFPTKDRIALVSGDYYADLLTSSGVLNLGGANYGYDIARKGSVDAQSESPLLLNDGYIGTIAGVPFHFVSDLVLETACAYVGLPSNTLESVICLIASGHGTLFGLATGNSIETIPCPIGQGVRLLPKYRMGAACILPKSVAWLVDGDKFVNPYGVKDLFTEVTEWSYKAPGSRNKLVATLTAGSSSTSFTPSVTRYDENGNGFTYTACKGLWVVGSCSSIEEFLAAYNASGAVKGSVSAWGSANTFSGVTSGKVVSMLVCDTDGTIPELVQATAK